MAWLCLALVVGTPLLVSQLFDHPYRDAKFTLIWLVVSLGALTLASRPTLSLPTPIGGWLLIYCLALVLSMVGVIHGGRAAEYGFEQFAMLALLPMGATWLSTDERRHTFLWLLLVTTALVATIALAQDAGLIRWGVDRRWPYPSSTLGFKNLAGQVYLVGGVMGFACMLSPALSSRLRSLAGAVLILSLWGIWSVRTRSCGLGMALAIGAILALSLRGYLPLNLKATWRSSIAGALAAVMLVFMCLDVGPGMTKTRAKRAPTDASTLDTRVIRWSNSADVWLDHPMTGVGLGNFRVHYPKYGQSDPQQNERMNVHEAHNEYLQVLVECGVMGLIAWLGLLGSIMLGLWRALITSTSEEHRLFCVATAAALIGILAHTFFSFALRNPAPPVWCWLAVGAALGAPSEPREGWHKQVLSAGWFVFGISTLTWALWTAQTSHLTREGVRAIGQRQLSTAFSHLNAAAEHPNADRALLKLCYAYGKANRRQLAVRACQRAVERQPYNPIIHDQLARQYHAAGQLAEALVHYERVLELQPAFERARVERDKVKRLIEGGFETKGLWPGFRAPSASP